MTAQLQQKLDAIVTQIVTKYQLEKVILFGSAARGEVMEDAEKYLKAYIVAHSLQFRKTHDLVEMLER